MIDGWMAWHRSWVPALPTLGRKAITRPWGFPCVTVPGGTGTGHDRHSHIAAESDNAAPSFFPAAHHPIAKQVLLASGVVLNLIQLP